MLSKALGGVGSTNTDSSSDGNCHEFSTLALARMKIEKGICGDKRDDHMLNIHKSESSKSIVPGFEGSNGSGYVATENQSGTSPNS